MTDWREYSLADIIRLLAALEQHGGQLFVRGLIDRAPSDVKTANPRVTLGSLEKLLEQTGGDTILSPAVVAFVAHQAQAEKAGKANIQVAAVVRIIAGEVIPPVPEDFTIIGTMVKIRRDSKYAYQCSGEGVVIEKHPEGLVGCVRVLFHNGYKNTYRTGQALKGDSSCDLELVNPQRNPSTAIVTWGGGSTRVPIAIPDELSGTLREGDGVLVNVNTNKIVTVLNHLTL